MDQLLNEVLKGSIRALARAISLVENKSAGYKNILLNLPPSPDSVILGITGPPGAGKSTITDALIGQMVAAGKNVGVLCIDPSSPFNFGALLGDRIRMNRWYNHPGVYIRSLANRGALGGLHPSIIEITDVMKAFGFDYIIIETVGVGQSEVEIAGLADTTVIVLVPESGDEVQTMKAGLMEIGDIFVVNKADRPGADIFVKNLKQILQPSHKSIQREIPVVKTVASQNVGIDVLLGEINNNFKRTKTNDRKFILLAEKAFQLIQNKRMNDIDKQELIKMVKIASEKPHFNLYSFAEQF